MRTTEGKPALGHALQGDEALATSMAFALAALEFTERATHGFHAYPAGIHPDTARDLLALFPSRSVLDPFCGGGTVLVEARIAGRVTRGVDLNPTAIRVARLRAASPPPEIVSRVRSSARKLAETARKAEEMPPERILNSLADWYAPCALAELESLRRGIEATEPAVREHLRGLFSSILVKVSWRESETSSRRVTHHRPPGTTAVLFHKKARELGRRWEALRALVPEGTPEAVLERGDAREIRSPEPVELVLTSPPYPATYDYLPMQHLRRVWLGDGDRRDEDELGSRRSWREGEKEARKRYAQDTNAWVAASAACLARNGHLVVVVGDGRTPRGGVDAAAPLSRAAEAAGLEQIARASVQREDHAHGALRWEHAFAFRKPS